MTARHGTYGKTVNRPLHVNEASQDLLFKLEAARLLCKTVGCAQRYLTHDALNGIHQSTKPTDDRRWESVRQVSGADEKPVRHLRAALRHRCDWIEEEEEDDEEEEEEFEARLRE